MPHAIDAAADRGHDPRLPPTLVLIAAVEVADPGARLTASLLSGT